MVAEQGASKPDMVVGKVVDRWVGTEVGEHDLDMLEDIRPDIDQLLKVEVLVENIGFDKCSPDRMRRFFPVSQD